MIWRNNTMDFFDEFDIAWIWVILVATVKK
jgi:hypothetical protein